MIKLDTFDIAILNILQEDNSISQRDISKRVNLSPSAVQRRIKRINSSGLICSNTTIINPDQIGDYITIIVEVELENEKKELIEKLKSLFLLHEEVQQCYYVTGQADFILIMVVSSMSRYESLTKEFFFDNNNVKRFRTFITMDRVKASLKMKI